MEDSYDYNKARIWQLKNQIKHFREIKCERCAQARERELQRILKNK